MDIADMCEFPFILPFVSLAAYHIGLEKIEGRWEWTRDSTLVFDPSLWNANEPNGQSVSPPESCGAFFRGSDINGMPGIADVPCCIPFHFGCEL